MYHFTEFTYFFIGKTPLGDSKGGGSNGQQISQQNVNPNGRNGQACCCAAGNFCPNPRDFEDGGFVSTYKIITSYINWYYHMFTRVRPFRIKPTVSFGSISHLIFLTF